MEAVRLEEMCMQSSLLTLCNTALNTACC